MTGMDSAARGNDFGQVISQRREIRAALQGEPPRGGEGCPAPRGAMPRSPPHFER
jgi:hypothetical protein